MQPVDFFNSKIIGIITTKPLNCHVLENGIEKNYQIESETYEIIAENDLFVICNFWYDESKQKPLFIAKTQIAEIHYNG